MKTTNPIILKESTFIDTRPGDEHGIIKGDGANINTAPNNRFWVVDDFYQDPDAVREYALLQNFFPGEGAVGSRTRKQFLFNGLKERFEEIMGVKIAEHTPQGTGWYDEGINGRFQSCKADTPMVFHCDSQKWAAVIYLTPNAPTQSGTSFYKHKASGVRHGSEIDNAYQNGHEVFNGKTFLDPTPYEKVDVVGNVYNRLVIFDGQLIHSGNDYFGWDFASSRFFQIFFFDVE